MWFHNWDSHPSRSPVIGVAPRKFETTDSFVSEPDWICDTDSATFISFPTLLDVPESDNSSEKPAKKFVTFGTGFETWVDWRLGLNSRLRIARIPDKNPDRNPDNPLLYFDSDNRFFALDILLENRVSVHINLAISECPSMCDFGHVKT